MKIDFTFDGKEKDYKKVIEDITWLLYNTLEKDISNITVQVTEGEEANYIRGLVAEVFSESEVTINIL